MEELEEKTNLLIKFGLSKDYISELNQSKIHELTTNNALYCYSKNYYNPKELSLYNHHKIAALTDGRSIKSFESKYFTPIDLLKLDHLKIRYLTSDNAIISYQSGYYKPTDLINKEPSVIWHLTNDIALSKYLRGDINPKNILDLSDSDIAIELGYSSSKMLKEAILYGDLLEDTPKDDPIHMQNHIDPHGIIAELLKSDLE